MAARGEPLNIVQATPSVWDSGSEVDLYVRGLASALAERGHSITVLAPASSRRGRGSGKSNSHRLAEPGTVQVVPITGAPGQDLTRRRRRPVGSEASRQVSEILSDPDIDIVHVHEPYTPSLPSSVLRHSFALNVGTFHLPQERVLSAQLARPLVEIFLGRLDARTVAHPATRSALERYFPGTYELIRGGVAPSGVGERDRSRYGPASIFYRASEERSALRTFLRALRRLPLDLEWSATVALPDSYGAPPRLASALRRRVEFVPYPGDIGGQSIVCLASAGTAPTPSTAREAVAAGAIPVASDIQLHSDLLDDGALGPMFPPGDADTLAGQLARLLEGVGEGSADSASHRFHSAAETADIRSRTWNTVVADFEKVYEATVSRRHLPEGNPALRKELRERDLIEVDLHMHTDHSPDCATPVRVLLETALDRGLGAIAITDHNEISGAVAAKEIAQEMDGIEVIIGEEVKTAEQGEVIGLFLKELIPRGMSMSETIAAIREQGGLVYMPHPFDRLHSVPDYEHLVDVVDEIDFMEVFNPRVALSSFNEEAERFARKYRIIPAAGSDSHVAQGLGSVRVRIPRFEGPTEFKEAMRDAEITRRHKNLVYVQALKFLQTTGRPKAPKRELSAAQPVRGGRPSRR